MQAFRKRMAGRLQKLRREWNKEFYDCIRDVAEHPVVLRMKLYPHHGSSNCYQIGRASCRERV